VPLLGICTNDTLNKVETILLEKVQEFAKGNGIDLSDLTVDCTFLTDQLGFQDQNLKNLFNILLKSTCTLKDEIDTLSAKISESTVFDLSCLTVDVQNPSQSDILQAAIYKICADSLRIENIEADYVKASQLDGLIQDYLNNISSGTDTGVQWNTRMIPYVAYPYHGQLSNFDAGGKGFPNLGFANVYICNGSNGTPDYRGRSPLGANVNVPGGEMSSDVNPNTTANAAYGIGLNTPKGEYAHALINAENAAHTHSITDPGHSHFMFANVVSSSLTGITASTQAVKAYQSSSSSSDNEYYISGTSTAATQGKTSVVKTGVSAANSGSGKAHNTLHPVIGCYFIMYIPS